MTRTAEAEKVSQPCRDASSPLVLGLVGGTGVGRERDEMRETLVRGRDPLEEASGGQDMRAGTWTWKYSRVLFSSFPGLEGDDGDDGGFA
jgi:hypothetical protein